MTDQQRWSRGHNVRDQGQGHISKSEAKAKDSPSEDKASQGQGQECSRPRLRTKDTGASVVQKNFVFEAIFEKKVVKKIFASASVT